MGTATFNPGRTREDTVRQIVAGLTGDSDGTGDLAVELSKTDPASLETGQDSEDDSGEPEDWVPDPVDADPGQFTYWPHLCSFLGFFGGLSGSGYVCCYPYLAMSEATLLQIEGVRGPWAWPYLTPASFHTGYPSQL